MLRRAEQLLQHLGERHRVAVFDREHLELGDRVGRLVELLDERRHERHALGRRRDDQRVGPRVGVDRDAGEHARLEPLLARGVDRDHPQQRREALGRGVGVRARPSPRTARCSTGASVDASECLSLNTRISLTVSPPGWSIWAISSRTSAMSLGLARTIERIGARLGDDQRLGAERAAARRSSASVAVNSPRRPACACSARACFSRNTSNCVGAGAGMSSCCENLSALATVLGEPTSSTALGRPSGRASSRP